MTAFLLPAILLGMRTWQAISCDFPPKRFLEKPRAEFHDRYVNEVYDYSIIIPTELTGYSDPGPSPQHGFGLILGDHENGYIDVNGERNSLDFLTAFDVALNLLDDLEKEHKNIESATIGLTRLDRLAAVNVVVIYTCTGSTERYRQSAIIALSADRDNVYTITLYSSPNPTDRDRVLLDQLVKSWRYTPSP